MKIKKFNESIRDKMTGVEGIPNFAEKRNNIFKEEYSIVKSTFDFIYFIINNFQFDISSPYYHGFINIGLHVIEDDELEKKFRSFVDFYEKGGDKYINELFKKLRFEVERVSLDETIIISTIKTKKDLWKDES